jgi:hypothetical protein
LALAEVWQKTDFGAPKPLFSYSIILIVQGGRFDAL